MARYDAEAEALKLRKIELEVHELVEVEDAWTGHMREEEQLVYAGPAGSTVIAALRAAHEAGAEEMRERAAAAAADALAEWSTRSIAAGRAIRALPTEPGEEASDD